ncbi:MAG: EpsI family protein, partial [Sedimentisphaerales bacterium]|nr:EpsI family protein [Sedimentisphaerales bacterium]
PVSQGALDRLPMQLGNWTGQEVPVEEEIVRATDTDAHVSRRYTKGVGFESISLWMASGVRARDLMPHRPEVCYTGAGWTLMGRRSMELPLSADEKLPCNVMQFSRGALNSEGVMVLDYYVVDGQYCADISLLRSRAWRGGGAVGYVAQVQIVTSVPSADSAESALKLVSDFAVESSPAIVRLFETSQEARPGEGDRESSGRQ